MIRMAQQQYIKDLYENEEVSLREIARRTKLSFQTVQKYAYKEDWNKEELPNLEAENYPALQAYIPTIDEWMEVKSHSPSPDGTFFCPGIQKAGESPLAWLSVSLSLPKKLMPYASVTVSNG